MPGRPLIRDYSPPLTWAASGTQTVRVECALRAGLTLADYGTFTLTIREDPEWPRDKSAELLLPQVDPIADGWEASATATGAADGATTIEFDVTVPSGTGYRRYAVDVVATGGTVGRVQLVEPLWLTVGPTLKS